MLKEPKLQYEGPLWHSIEVLGVGAIWWCLMCIALVPGGNFFQPGVIEMDIR